MGFLKGLATFILSFLFFITFTVFTTAFMLNGTVLSYDFVSNQVDKVPISSIARDVAEDQLGGILPQNSEFLKEVAFNVIEKQEPWIKTQLKAAVKTGYDYFLGKTNYLSITVPLSDLKTSLNNSVWQEFTSYLQTQLAGKSDAQITAYLQDIIRQLPHDIYPPELAALPPDSRNQYIEQYLRDIGGVNQNPAYPPLDPATNTLINQYIDETISKFINDIPNDQTWDESTINADTMRVLHDVRRGIGYFQTYYLWLIVLLIVLAALIFLVNWSVKAPARALGIDLLVIGVIDLAGIIIMRTLPVMDWASNILKTDIPASLSSWITNLVNDVTAVALPLTIGILVVGVVLLVVSIVIPSRKSEV